MYDEKIKSTGMKIFLSLLGLILFFGIWELAVDFGLISERKLVAPSAIVLTFIDKLHNVVPDGNTITVHTLTSLKLVVAGFLLSCVIGVPLGLLMGFFKPVNRFFAPVFEIVRPIPPLAWIPIVIVVLGIGIQAEVFIIFVAAFVPCVINSYTGIQSTSQTLLNVAKTAGATNAQLFFKIGVPSALPMVFTGIKISFGSAWATLVAAEMIASTVGLGFMIQQGRSAVRPDIVILGMSVIGLIGAVLTSLLSILEKKALPWRNPK